MNCPFKCGDVCLWASKLAANKPIRPTERDCSRCLKLQKESRKRKGFQSRRTWIVETLAAKALSKSWDTPVEDVFGHLRKDATQWKRHHIRDFIKNKQSPYFRFLMTVAFYECGLNNSSTDWIGSDFVGYLKEYNESFPEGFNPNIEDLSSKGSFFKSFDRFLKTYNKNLGDVLKEVEYPVWVEPIEDVKPDPKNKNCIITVCSGDKNKKMFDTISDRYESYAKKCNADFVVLDGYTQGWWGLEKFRIKPFIEAYDRTCFLDSDIIIQKTAPNIFDMVPVDSIGIHDDWACLVNKEYNFLQWKETERKWLVRSQVPQEDFSYDTHDILLNTGVVVTSKQHADIWTPMKAPFPRNHCDEQFWVEYLLTKKNYDIYRLPLSMNLQHWMDCFHKSAGLKTTHFLHIAIDHTRVDKSEAFEEVYDKYAD
jgi:hypothetical protein